MNHTFFRHAHDGLTAKNSQTSEGRSTRSSLCKKRDRRLIRDHRLICSLSIYIEKFKQIIFSRISKSLDEASTSWTNKIFIRFLPHRLHSNYREFHRCLFRIPSASCSYLYYNELWLTFNDHDNAVLSALDTIQERYPRNQQRLTFCRLFASKVKQLYKSDSNEFVGGTVSCRLASFLKCDYNNVALKVIASSNFVVLRSMLSISWRK